MCVHSYRRSRSAVTARPGDGRLTRRTIRDVRQRFGHRMTAARSCETASLETGRTGASRDGPCGQSPAVMPGLR